MLLFSVWRIPTSLSTDQQTTKDSLGQMSLFSFCLTSLFSFNKHVGSLVSTFPASLFTTSLLIHWVSITIRLSPPAFYRSYRCQSQPSWWLNAAQSIVKSNFSPCSTFCFIQHCWSLPFPEILFWLIFRDSNLFLFSQLYPYMGFSSLLFNSSSPWILGFGVPVIWTFPFF